MCSHGGNLLQGLRAAALLLLHLLFVLFLLLLLLRCLSMCGTVASKMWTMQFELYQMNLMVVFVVDVYLLHL